MELDGRGLEAKDPIHRMTVGVDRPHASDRPGASLDRYVEPAVVPEGNRERLPSFEPHLDRVAGLRVVRELEHWNARDLGVDREHGIPPVQPLGSVAEAGEGRFRRTVLGEDAAPPARDGCRRGVRNPTVGHAGGAARAV